MSTNVPQHKGCCVGSHKDKGWVCNRGWMEEDGQRTAPAQWMKEEWPGEKRKNRGRTVGDCVT